MIKYIVNMKASFGFSIPQAETEAEAERKAKMELHRMYPDIPLECLSSDLFFWDVIPWETG